MKNKLGVKFWTAMLIFGLVGQIAWVVENMYLNVFIYKMFRAGAEDISLMVSSSAVVAALTTIFIGAWSDRIGKRKSFMCFGYIIWGVAIVGFALIKVEKLSSFFDDYVKACALGILLVIILDCIMTFFGSMANDACYNAWLTDCGNESNRGKIEGFNSMMPLIAILVVFGGFMGFDLEQSSSWMIIFTVIGVLVFVIGAMGVFLIDDKAVKVSDKSNTYWKNIIYSFRPSVVRQNKLLYAVLLGFAIFGISIQVFMPYLIIYYEKSLGMTNYIFIMAPAILLAAVVTALYGKVYDMLGFKMSMIPSIGLLIAGYVILFFTKTTIPVFLGSFLMMSGYLTGMSVFGAMIRDNIPRNKAGQFQGIRIMGQVLVPGVIGPYIGAFVLRNAEQILNNDGTYSFLPNKSIWVAATLVALLLCVYLYFVFRMMRTEHYELESEHKEVQWNSHPRPQMKRDNYFLLNGLWKLNNQDIFVPFPPEAKLSGYHGKIGSKLSYEKQFMIPKDFSKDKVLLHFGAVDQVANVWLNDVYLGTHKGGYLPFSFDITNALFTGENNVLRVEAIDTLSKEYPYGKQTQRRGGMWYTKVSGIWQSVWLENVPNHYIEKLAVTPSLNSVHFELQAKTKGFHVTITLPDGSILKKEFLENTGDITIEAPILWTPENPYLYPTVIETKEDRIETYFALRTIEIKEIQGVNRVVLNNEPIFLHGVLDQGYFCDGIFLPAQEKEYERDILRMKALGYNMLRKHIKIEPECFYYACDKLGMLVVQDMVNSGRYSFIKDTAMPTIGQKRKKDRSGIKGNRKEFFVEHTKDTLKHLYNHPCIVAYTIFNEGWGQFESDKIYEMVKSIDATRLIDSTSGWFRQNASDFDSEHVYFKVIKLPIAKKPLFLSECGGYSLSVEGHHYSKFASYGYGTCNNFKELSDVIVHMYEEMVLNSIDEGMCGCVYTQLSDVEDEINGLYTYDRQVCKVNKEAMNIVAKKIQQKMECFHVVE